MSCDRCCSRALHVSGRSTLLLCHFVVFFVGHAVFRHYSYVSVCTILVGQVVFRPHQPEFVFSTDPVQVGSIVLQYRGPGVGCHYHHSPPGKTVIVAIFCLYVAYARHVRVSHIRYYIIYLFCKV